MYNVNPTELIKMIKEGQNPQQLMLNILEGNMNSSPMGANILSLVKEGKTADIEQIARNMFKDRGLDFDKEFTNFRNTYGL